MRAWQIWGHLSSPLTARGGQFASRLLWEAEGIDLMTPQEKAGLWARLNRIALAAATATRPKGVKSDPLFGTPPGRRKGRRIIEGNEPDG